MLLSALENQNPRIRGGAVDAFGLWLADFSDSGKTQNEPIRITPEIEQLRDTAISKIIGLLSDETMAVQDMDIVNVTLEMGIEFPSIHDCATIALTLSGTDAAQSALESWKGFEGRELLPPV